VKAKHLLQMLWKSKISWDQDIQSDLQTYSLAGIKNCLVLEAFQFLENWLIAKLQFNKFSSMDFRMYLKWHMQRLSTHTIGTKTQL